MISLLLMSLKSNVKFHSLYDQGQFCGIAYYVESDDTVYLTYLAVNKDLRGHGYGSRILSLLEDKYPGKQLVIDIEPITKSAKNYRQRVNRLKFYNRNGFHLTNQKLKDQDGSFSVMTTGKRLNKKGFIKTLKEMSFGFYQFKVEK
ncbi:GNAT superfamily N-acetyltransferase [Lactobacillus colini]|uniref:GNAT superfamily N-acetyltransferase n=2 Tax=Lactobacillus colini TaxID=1819254 RepID=A0ABS4ME19_9LACO|nr:GNAT superfamily N-acetyltransferase [Lactobacillus colini]